MTLAALTALSLTAAVAEEAPRTVSDYAGAMEASATRIDALVTQRQKAGDMAAAQRLVLAAAMVRRVGEEFRGAEQEALTDDVGGLPAPVPQRLAAAFAKAGEVVKRADDPAFVDDAQRTFNALMSVLPMNPPHPIFYGVLARDLSANPLPGDLVIYGYRVIDPILKIPPVVLFRNTDIDALAIKGDRIDVTLPPDMRQAVDFAPPPCEARSGFGIRVVGAYAQKRGIWPISWNSELQTSADVFVLPSPVFYTAKILARVEAPTEKTMTQPFEAKSELEVADCGETRFASVDVPLPAGFKNLTCSGTWIDASGAADVVGRCLTEGLTLHVTGELKGGNKVCSPAKLCTCPNSAQGFLEAKGSYQVATAGETVRVDAQAPPVNFPAGALSEGPLVVGASGALRHVTLSFSRRGCPTAVDALDLNIGDDPNGKADAVSKTGAFRAILQRNTLTVGAFDAFPTALDKTP
jgi:hypothetical protein